jgi:hypothetical protein
MKKSLVQQIYEYYINGGKLTTVTCLNLFHTTELRSINCKIQKLFGIKLSSERVTGKPYKEFYLQKQLKLF